MRAITNGVHPLTWACDSVRRLFDTHLPHWCHEPELLMHADLIVDEAIRAAHAEAKEALGAEVLRCGGPPLDVALPWIGFARRMTRYKRPEMLFSDLDRLREIARSHPFAVVLAGKAHPNDVEGKQSIERLHAIARELEGTVPVVTAGLRHAAGALAGLWSGRLAEYAAAAPGGIRHERHEGGTQRRAEPERA